MLQASAWPRRVVPGDLVRALAAVSVVVGTWLSGPVATALFLLVLGGSLVPRVIGVPASLDVAYCGALVLAAWAAQLGWYDAVGWLDVAVHAVATGLVALVAVLALVRWGVLPSDLVDGARHPRWGSVLLVAGTGGALAVLWEIGEWAGHTFLDPSIHVGYQDTVGDLAAGLTGSVVAGLALARRRRLVVA
jgi:hypothetical protein